MLFLVISKIRIWQLCLSLCGRPDQLWSMFLCGACFQVKEDVQAWAKFLPVGGRDTIVIFFLTKKHFWWFSSVQSLIRVWLFATPWIAAHQASLSITNPRSLLKLMPIKSVMPSSHFILCHSLLLLPPIPPIIRVFFNESTLCMRWLKYWSFSFFHLFWSMNFNICVKVKSESHSVMSDSLWPHRLFSPCNSPSQNTGEVSHSFHQGLFPTQARG